MRPYVERHPTEWSRQLPIAEFAANNAISMATGFSPFYFHSSDHPLMPTALLRGDVSTPIEAVHIMTDRMRSALEEAQANLSLVQCRARSQANKSQRDESFKVGDEVVLSTKHLHLDQHLLTKLRRRWVGPFRVSKVLSLVAYGLDLPPRWKIHPVFHVSNLKSYFRSI